MLLFAGFALVGIGVWWIAKKAGDTKLEAESHRLAKRSVEGASAVVTDLFGSVGGQGAPDFGPAPADRYDDESDHQVRLDAPPRPPDLP